MSYVDEFQSDMSILFLFHFASKQAQYIYLADVSRFVSSTKISLIIYDPYTKSYSNSTKQGNNHGASPTAFVTAFPNNMIVQSIAQQNKHMIKDNPADMLLEQPETSTASQSNSPRAMERSIKKKLNDYYDLVLQSQPPKHSTKVIKITQFNSSLIIGEDRVTQKNHSASTSPQKNFNIKKIVEFKNKVLAGAQKAVEIQLKKKDYEFIINLKPGTAKKTAKQSIDKILAAAQSNIKHDVLVLEKLASSITLDGDMLTYENEQSKEQLADMLLAQKYQLLQSKDSMGEIQARKGKGNSMSCKYGVSMLEFDKQGESQSMSPMKKLNSPRKMYSKHIIEQKKYQQNLQKEKRQVLQLKKELNKNYAKPFIPPENITAQAYIIYETEAKKIQYNRKMSIKKHQVDQIVENRKMLINSHKVVASSNPRTALEIASLTKIMTCIVVIEIAQKFNLSLFKQCITIGGFEQNIGGTTANIKKGEIYTIQQLLYGLMLPSGNDASLALAVWAGKTLLQREYSQTEKSFKVGSSSAVNLPTFPKKQAYQRFIVEMNAKASLLNMQKTHFVNSHGLSNPENKSCVFDLAILCEYAMSNKKFREIVGTRFYECQVNLQKPVDNSYRLQEKDSGGQMGEVVKYGEQYFDGEECNFEGEEDMNEIEEMRCKLTENALIQAEKDQHNAHKTARWQNSHLLLQTKPDIYFGIKTGVTTTAGPCLASCVEYKGKRFIIVVLNCKSMKHRFKDTQHLRKWLFTKQQYKYKQKQTVEEPN